MLPKRIAVVLRSSAGSCKFDWKLQLPWLLDLFLQYLTWAMVTNSYKHEPGTKPHIHVDERLNSKVGTFEGRQRVHPQALSACSHWACALQLSLEAAQKALQLDLVSLGSCVNALSSAWQRAQEIEIRTGQRSYNWLVISGYFIGFRELVVWSLEFAQFGLGSKILILFFLRATYIIQASIYWLRSPSRSCCCDGAGSCPMRMSRVPCWKARLGPGLWSQLSSLNGSDISPGQILILVKNEENAPNLQNDLSS